MPKRTEENGVNELNSHTPTRIKSIEKLSLATKMSSKFPSNL